MTSPVNALLTNDPAVSALVGSRVYRSGRAPQHVGRPYITWSTVGGHTENYLAERPGIEQALVQIDCWSNSEAECKALADAVVAALETHAHQDGVAMDDYESETELFRQLLQFHFWNPRPS